ncbi:hypothetical protein EPD60_12910 [Flaviaesturariibacter flavus]|uniref:Neurotransmitter-gated ion-channel ligand-binding domain-containing protein n=1 Tax=Flaviaesturariibacter flavus TaxID=2502780 RepID=A0A4R1B7X2_9BACT|nr:hypothetical protein [Flaviaesturariibacter flavus]TCJ13287.1 hypothetical protein EPD60_12910 [Flaviaesturariibacter flavus]
MRIPILLTAFLFILARTASAQAAPPDTVRTGVYITSIHDIDFKQKEYAMNLWLWLRYKNRKFDFLQNLEIPQAKTVEKSFSTIDTSNGGVYVLMKLQCLMKDSWKIGNFPFDRQTLRLSIENSQFDSSELVFAADTVGAHYDSRFALRGWNIDSCVLATGNKVYETGFGDTSIHDARSTYSTFRVRMVVRREAGGLFWKMFLGMYIAFFIAFVCFFIHSDSIDSRFGLSVGALFAVIGNKYIIDSALPESSSFTLVDALHGLTLFMILAIVSATIHSLTLAKKDKLQAARSFDFRAALAVGISYLLLNAYFILSAWEG